MARSRSGDPRIYDRFLHTIVQAGLTDTVMPLRLPSLTAARLVHVLGYIVDIVYLDSAHEAGETFMELSLWWEVLKPGGVMLGDDYAWQSVRHDLDLFVKVGWRRSGWSSMRKADRWAGRWAGSRPPPNRRFCPPLRLGRLQMHNLELLFNPEEGEETWYLKKPL